MNKNQKELQESCKNIDKYLNEITVNKMLKCQIKKFNQEEKV